ncbi:MAG: hypothetical protein A2Y84_00910 [Candidatus Colwellbacteria bacterium RBG_13_48_8]|uniref:peptidoglycan glycosyltransferase n=1 Tax=Candidatus Colwellbacteria bacterium RBG_13_48_8 TaxID=1797685 RepID=A0A1G1YX29_9BACT|nr:MAG: hypothetical protein A2Y84_00910 [Candidatus Colwellbacteria bacterium RBG_13_48_8]
MAQSINVPSVKTLYLAGLEKTMKTAELFGITTLNDPNRYGLSLVLGGGEVKLVDLLTAYSVLANDGTKHKPTFILKVEDSRGKVLEEYKEQGEQVVDPQYPRTINDILSDVGLRSGLFSASLPLTQVPGYQVALKTGTTNDYVDAWAIGYTPNLVAGVWAGNNNRVALEARGSSILAAIPMWHDFMSQALPQLPAEFFPKPEPFLSENPVLSGKLIEGENHSILYYLGRLNDPQYPNWEAGIKAWLSTHPESSIKIPRVEPGEVNKTGTGVDKSIEIDFISPNNGETVESTFPLRVSVAAPDDLDRVEVFVNNELVLVKSGHLGKEVLISEDVTIEGSAPQNLISVETIDKSNNAAREEIIVFL